MRKVRASIIGFGSVGQGVAEVLLRKGDELKSLGIDLDVVAIADSKGAEVNLAGIDLKAALGRKREFGTVAIDDLTGEDVIKSVDHDIVIETTPTDIETGGVGLVNMVAGAGEVPGHNSKKLAEIIAAAVLAGEISLIGAQAAGHLAKAHAELGR